MRTTILAFSMMIAPALMATEPSTATVRGITLPEAYRLSLAQSETLAQSAQGVKALEAAERQIRSSFMPSVNGVAAQSTAEKSKAQGQAGFSLNYALFSGMRDYIAARSAGLTTRAARLELTRARQALYLDVAQAYITLANVRQEIGVRRDQLEVSSNRIKELTEREEIGRSRKSELVAAQTQLAQDNSALESAKGREDFAQLELGFLTGLGGDLAPELLPVPQPLTRESYLLKAETRFDVEAARRTRDAARLDVDVEKHLRWPTVNAAADYFPVRSTPDEDVHWDAGLSLNVPIFTGGFIGASVDAAKARARSAELALALVSRRSATEVNEAFSILHHSVATLNSLLKAVALAEENARLQSREYTHALVTNLDVLNAQNTLLQTRLDLEAARAQTCLAGIQLEFAAGGPEPDSEDK